MKRGKLFYKLQRRFRTKRFKICETLLRDILRRQPEVSILDTGGRPDYWEILPPDLRDKVRITCLNFQSELDIYSNVSSDLQIESVVGNACNMPEVSDNAFDLVHSNSVIEHVGSYQNMKRYADEVKRVGKNHYIQTPNYWFPIEPHYGVPFVHWLPDVWRAWLFTHFRIGYAGKCSFDAAIVRIDRTRIISAFILQQFFPQSRIQRERLLLFTKSITAINSSGIND